MKYFIKRHHRLLFYSAWLLVGLLQAALTPLQDDEAYYWVFSRFLDWGYFDHPPMTALLIKMGYALFQNELGVRLFMVLLSTATVAVCEALTEQKSPPLFYAVCAVLAVLQLSGFMAVPDIPLLTFTALFFYVYRLFLQRPSLRHTAWLSVAMAALMWSKYHAVLVIAAAFLSNPKLLARWQTHAAGAFALLLFVPHLWWQYGHDWISFRYHLFESNVNPYKVNYTTDYLLGQLLITGPLAGFILLPVLFLYKPKSSTERALKVTGIGILAFFFLSTFKGKVEANWTAPMVVPILVLGHQYLVQHKKQRRWIYNLIIPTLLLVVFIRFVMIADVVPAKVVRERFHYWHRWPQQLSEKTGRLPVALSSSYQMAAQWWFYGGTPALSVNEYARRRNNYNFWPLEDSMLGRPALVFDGPAPQDSMQTPMGMLRYAVDSSFHAFGKIWIVAEQKTYVIGAQQPLAIKATVAMPDYYSAYLKQQKSIDAPVKIGVFQGRDWLFDIPLQQTVQSITQQPQQIFYLPISLKKGTYFLRFAIGSDAGWYTHNSDKIIINVQ